MFSFRKNKKLIKQLQNDLEHLGLINRQNEKTISELKLTNSNQADSIRHLQHEVAHYQQLLDERPVCGDTIATLNLNDYVVIRDHSFPCDRCNLSIDCKKLSFHEGTICIARHTEAEKLLIKSAKKNNPQSINQ